MSNGTFLYPNVTSLPSTGGVGGTASERLSNRQNEAVPGEFDRVFEGTMGKLPNVSPGPDLNQLKTPLKFSAHASQRLHDRRITLDQATMSKVSDAVDRAAAKGVEDTLVLTGNAALIVNVPNRTVITAMDRQALDGNVFTNIDGAIILN
ncbi:MAG: TIGR02530 family flagellar biosynthesis protein [Bdellovibrionota bacterium]